MTMKGGWHCRTYKKNLLISKSKCGTLETSLTRSASVCSSENHMLYSLTPQGSSVLLQVLSCQRKPTSWGNLIYPRRAADAHKNRSQTLWLFWNASDQRGQRVQDNNNNKTQNYIGSQTLCRTYSVWMFVVLHVCMLVWIISSDSWVFLLTLHSVFLAVLRRWYKMPGIEFGQL